MKINKTLTVLLLVFVGLISLRAQPAAVQQLEQNKRVAEQQQSEKSLSLTPGENAPELYPGENTDVGPQRILRLKPARRTWFEAVADTQYFYTDNAFLSEDPTTDASVFVNTVQFALAPTPFRLGNGKFAPALGFRSQWYNYEGGNNVDLLNFNVQTLFLSSRYRVGTWDFSVGFEYTRLLDQRRYNEFYVEYVPNVGVQRLFQISEKMIFAVGWQTAYHFSRVDPNPRRDLNDRWDSSVTAALTYQIVPKLVVQPYYRFQYTYYPHNTLVTGDRSDTLHSLGVSLAYYFNTHVGVRTFINADFRDSNDPTTADYCSFNAGLGASLNFRF